LIALTIGAILGVGLVDKPVCEVCLVIRPSHVNHAQVQRHS